MPILKGAALEFSEQILKGRVVPYIDNPTTVIGVNNILKPDPERVFMHVSNLSANDMYVGFAEDVTSTNGVLLSGNGGYVTLKLADDLLLLTYPIHIFSNEAANQLYIISMQRQTRIME